MNNIMKLADAYAEASFDQGLARTKNDTKPEAARSALEAAVNQQAAEIERLNHKDKLITKWTENGELIERLYSAGLEQERELTKMAAEISALQAKLSAMESVEPIGCGYVVKWETGDTPSTYQTGYAQVLGVDVYTAPKVAQPTDARSSNCSNTLRMLGKPYPRTCKECGLTGPCKYPITAHGIGGQQP